MIDDREIVWLYIKDARGNRIGITKSSDEHKDCIDIITDYNVSHINNSPNGFTTLLRIKKENIDHFIFALNTFNKSLCEWSAANVDR